MKNHLPRTRNPKSNPTENARRGSESRVKKAGNFFLLLFVVISGAFLASALGIGYDVGSGGKAATVEDLVTALTGLFSSSSNGQVLTLSKEYIYADNRLLAVEDPGSRSAAPADLAVWRPKSGTWWVLGGNSGSQSADGWGMNGDIPTQGDFDGDGKTDLCVFRPSTGEWWILRSSDGSHYAVTYGGAGDEPAQADFDGDGKTDIAVFRPTEGIWYIIESTTGSQRPVQFGFGTDMPAPADFDGDGLADIAVWRSSARTFFVLGSSNSAAFSYQFASASSQPVPADYDGDGRADFAIRTGNDWIYHSSLTGRLETIEWQQGSDISVQNDYDGDGIVDVAVWRPSDGTWHIRNSSNGGTRTEQWGAPGDIPVPAFYRR